MLNLKNTTYYFTYANNKDFPFIGGWTEIEAPSKDVAIQLFNYLHPNTKHPDIVNCSFIYDANEFKNTIMYKYNTNMGHACWEHYEISIKKSEC